MPQLPLEYERVRPTPARRRIADAMLFSVGLGVGWGFVAMCLMGQPGGVFTITCLIASIVAGVAGGWFTIWSRGRRGGRESFLGGIANFYFDIAVFSTGLVAIERVQHCIQWGGWTDFDLHDHLMLIAMFGLYGTVPWGILLIPLCFLSRHLVWNAYAGGDEE
jgi:hypothetical protein